MVAEETETLATRETVQAAGIGQTGVSLDCGVGAGLGNGATGSPGTRQPRPGCDDAGRRRRGRVHGGGRRAGRGGHYGHSGGGGGGSRASASSHGAGGGGGGAGGCGGEAGAAGRGGGSSLGIVSLNATLTLGDGVTVTVGSGGAGGAGGMGQLGSWAGFEGDGGTAGGTVVDACDGGSGGAGGHGGNGGGGRGGHAVGIAYVGAEPAGGTVDVSLPVRRLMGPALCRDMGPGRRAERLHRECRVACSMSIPVANMLGSTLFRRGMGPVSAGPGAGAGVCAGLHGG
jgi:hypothetical protein